MALQDALVWVDLEMTGLDPSRDRILEVACLITDRNLEIVAEGPGLVLQASEEELAAMNAWCRENHGRSGLTQACRDSRVSLADAEEQILTFLKKYLPKGASPLCGNTISQDRRFLVKYMPKLEAFFHYRNLDVSTLKELSRRWKPEVYANFKKQQKHTALADVHESIDELAHYREHFIRL